MCLHLERALETIFGNSKIRKKIQTLSITFIFFEKAEQKTPSSEKL